MAFGARQISPLDTRPGTAVGISIPFNAPSVFSSTYTTKDAIKNNLINFLLTDPGERYLNINFGAGLKKFLFEQINENNFTLLKDTIQSQIKIYFPNIKINTIDINGNPDTNEVNVVLNYSILNTGVTDQAQITFS
jgi:phage baseplate assembly protein W